MPRDDAVPRGDQPRRWAWLETAPHRGWRPAHPVRATLIGAVLAGYAWVDAEAAPFSARSLVGVLIPAAVLGAIAFRRPPQRIPPPERLDVKGTSYWLICIVALFEWEASAFKDYSLTWHPSLTDLINPLLSPHLVKSAAIMVWILAGWGLVKR